MGEGAQAVDPLGIIDGTGWQVVWLHHIGDVWVIDECKVILADATLTRRAVADALWLESCEQWVG